MSESDGYLFSRQWLTILIEHANQQGISVALVNSPQNRHQLKYFRELFHRVPALRFTYDIGHSNIGVPQSLTRDYLFALADRLELVHLSDNDGSDDQHLPMGAPQTGGIDLNHELRTLRTFSFDGDITLQVAGDPTWLQLARDRLRDTWDSLP
jgi:sugar phosphate isomerase/epimerase